MMRQTSGSSLICMEPRETLSLEQIDLSDLGGFWGLPWEEREGAFRTLRREDPVRFFKEPDVSERTSIPVPPGPGYFALTRHADVTLASRRPEIFTSGQGATSVVDLPPEMLEYFGGMINLDNPRHARLRRIVSAAFNPRMIASVEEDIRRVASGIVDNLVDRGECDFVADVAARLPLTIICNMMGVPESQYDTVFRCSNIILSAGDTEYVPEDADIVVALLEAGAELTQLLQEVAVLRQNEPADDLITALVTANVDGEHLTHEEIASFFILLAVAGNETTRTAISHGLWALTQHPAQRARWLSDIDGMTPTAVDEIVRWSSPVIFMRRTLATDTPGGRPVELAGTELHPGDKVLLFYNSANRDEDVFDDPFTFDVGRDPNPHLGFGAAGPHFCLGAHLARQEISVMFRELLERVPAIVATRPPDRLLSNFVHGIKHLPCDVSGRNPAG